MRASIPSAKDSSQRRRISSGNPRFYIPSDAQTPEPGDLPAREVHHALHVVHVRVGDHVELLNGQGERFLCRVTETGRHHFRWEVIEREKVPPLPWQLTLVQALTRHKSMELLIQKATELGATRVVPLLTERVVVKLRPEDAGKERSSRAAIDAMKQSGNAWLPRIDPPMALSEFLLNPTDFELSLLASLRHDTHPRRALDAWQDAAGRPPGRLSLWVGPEGDFTDSELESIVRHGATPVSLGPLVLRSETAALYLLSILSYEMQSRWGSP